MHEYLIGRFENLFVREKHTCYIYSIYRVCTKYSMLSM